MKLILASAVAAYVLTGDWLAALAAALLGLLWLVLGSEASAGPPVLFFAMACEHSVVNMFLFPSGMLLGGKFSILDYFIWNEIPTVLGNLVGGLAFTGLTLYATHVKTAPKRSFS